MAQSVKALAIKPDAPELNLQNPHGAERLTPANCPDEYKSDLKGHCKH